MAVQWTLKGMHDALWAMRASVLPSANCIQKVMISVACMEMFESDMTHTYTSYQHKIDAQAVPFKYL